MKTRYTVSELEKLPTLAISQADDLKIEDLDKGLRVWLSRVDNEISVEKFNQRNGRWLTVEQYYDDR